MLRLIPNSEDTRVSVVQQHVFLAVMGSLFQGIHGEEITPAIYREAYRGIKHELPRFLEPKPPRK